MEELDWPKRIQEKIEGTGLRMVFQPIYRLIDGKRLGFEALARFDEPERALTDEQLTELHGDRWRLNAMRGMGPDVWFRQADLLGMGVAMEVAAVKKALLRLPEVPADNYLSVNVGPQTITSDALREVIDNVPLERVVLELTEHLTILDYPAIRTAVDDIQRMHSVKLCTQKIPGIAADDLGAGTASMQHLFEISSMLTFCKLDISMIRGIEHDQNRQRFASVIRAMGEDSGFKVVAEGIETKEQWRVLIELEVHAGQGYLLGRPGELPKE